MTRKDKAETFEFPYNTKSIMAQSDHASTMTSKQSSNVYKPGTFSGMQDQSPTPSQQDDRNLEMVLATMCAKKAGRNSTH